MAEYAVTQMVKKFGSSLRDMKNISQPPQTTTIETDINQKSVVYEDLVAVLEIELEKSTIKGLIQAIFIPNAPAYRVCFSSNTEENVALLDTIFTDLLERSNFYQGKTLRFSRDGVVFLPTPSTNLADVILPKGVHEEYRLNVVRFLRDPRFWEKVKKRSLLLYGPPGTGKTSSIAGFFNHLRQHNVSCVWISDDSFRRHNVESVFSFVNTYLAPCLMVFEDIDLIAVDRSVQASSIIGPLLSALNGIEEQQKPIVIVATTNRADVLDGAITRPCRFDRKLHIDYPSDDALAHMFKQKSGFEPTGEAFKQGSSKDKMLTGAHIEEIHNTAQLLALDSDREPIDCVEEAVEVIRENFFVVEPTLGFGEAHEGAPKDGAEVKECYPKPCPGHTPDDKEFYS
jgi:predicted AAA+ superfamily ATPase